MAALLPVEQAVAKGENGRSLKAHRIVILNMSYLEHFTHE